MFGRKAREHVEKARKRLSDSLLKLPRIKKGKSDPKEEDVVVVVQPQDATTRPASPMVMTALRVSVTARFESPVDKNFYHTCEVSPGFQDSDNVCDALLRRIDHCAHELITRPDPKASDPLSAEPRTKTARYHLIFRVDRKGLPWKERHFTSFQQKPMTLDAAHEVVLEVDRILSLFLHWHDPEFAWKLPSVVTEDPLKHTTANYEVGAPQTAQCIPTYRTQPGYSIDLILRTRSKGQNRSWGTTVDSQQATPLTLHLGEKLMSQVTAILHQAVRERRERFDQVHNHCDALEGTFGCRHFDEDAFDLVAKVRNNFGPDYPHFTIRIHTFQHLVGDGNAVAFMQNLKAQLGAARDASDQSMNATDDLVIRIHELRSKDWKVQQPLTVTVDSSILNCRKVTERILERVESRMTDVLRGHGTVASLTAHKRGHLVLETAVCHGEDTDFYDLKLFDSLHLKKRALQKRLRDRIQDDIAMVTKDTITLDNPGRGLNLKILAPADLAVEPLNANAEASQERMASSSQRILQKPPLLKIRRQSLEEAEEASKPESQMKLAHDHGYMADMVSKESNSLDMPTPSLADTASINLQDGIKTPQSARVASQNFDSTGLGIINFYDSHHGDMDTFQENADTPSKESIGTVIRRPQPAARTAANLLASYWEPAPSSSPGLEKSETTVFRDLREDPDIWGLHGDQKEAFSAKEDINPGLATEGSWLANKFPFSMVQGPSKTTPGESIRRPLSMTSGNSAPGKGKGKMALYKSDRNLNVARVEQPSAMAFNIVSDLEIDGDGGFKNAKIKSMSAQIGSRSKAKSLILGESNSSIRSFPRPAPAQAAPKHTPVQAEGLFHRRQVSTPTGGHRCLHGEWSIEMGLRNALMPALLQGDRSEQRVQSLPGWPSAWPRQFQRNLDR